jgi:hypothetical protein
MLQVGTLTKDERKHHYSCSIQILQGLQCLHIYKKEKPKSAQQIHQTIAKQVKIEEHILALQ